MPIALTPRRRSRDDFESDEGDQNVSPDMVPSSQPDLLSSKRARLANGFASPSTNGYHAQTNGFQTGSLHFQRSRRKHQPGSIVRVKLANFVTYTAVEFFPGPSLNMVIGPNGTGKSTLVCAICLGLGWGPQHLGRAKEVSEFVKHGCQEAMIEIELAKDGKKFRENLVIRCTIRREGNKTNFSVDDKPTSKKAVIELCRSLSIQIDNLCQFLPQDKVVEFAAMTPVELLRSTQRAVASQEMMDMHDELKDLRKKQRDAQARATADQETLTNLEGRQRLQEADVERMREREQVEKRVKMLEAARPFAQYRTARNAHTEVKARKKEAQSELTRLKDEVGPSLRALNAKEEYQKQIKLVIGERTNEVSKAEKHADSIDRKFRDSQDKNNDLVREHEVEANNGRRAKQDIVRFENVITNLKRQMEEQPPELDVQTYNQHIRDKKRTADTCTRQIRELKEHQQGVVQKGREVNGKIQQAKSGLSNLETQVGKRMNMLQAASRDTAKLWEWIQQHQGDFEKPVLGPPLVECSIKDPRYVDCIETLFQKNIFLSITTQTKNDFKRVSDAAASLHLEEVYFQTMLDGLENFRAPVREEDMKRFGFEKGWALDHLNGPEPILAMLCGVLHLHETGVSLRDTSPEQYDLIHNSPIQAWVTNKSVYRITRRREYGSGATSTQVRPIKKGQIWTEQPVDLTAKRELEEQIEGWNEEIAGLKTESSEAQKGIEEYRAKINAAKEEEEIIQTEKAGKQKALGEFRALPTKLATQEEKASSSKDVISGVRDRLKAITVQQDKIATQRAHTALDFANAVTALRLAHSALHEAEIMHIEATSDVETLKSLNHSVQSLLQESTRRVADLIAETSSAHEKAASLLSTCQRLLQEDNPNTTPDHRAFFRALPDYLAPDLEAEIESERARLELMLEGSGGDNGNDNVIREYEARRRKIDALTTRLAEFKDALADLDDTITRLRNSWEPRLDALVAQISTSFGANMAEISCAGEVEVYKDADDFDAWAIQIWVKFRENEPLSPLDSHRQSGGERAVSTIFYLMSLQSLTRSPFRVVDEINQGMDPRNERLVHKRMVGIACGGGGGHTRRVNDGDDGDDDGNEEEGGDGGGSQYFLITPKLLHNLTYERGMRVLCIASGEYMPPERDRVDFGMCLDTMKGLRAGVAVG